MPENSGDGVKFLATAGVAIMATTLAMMRSFVAKGTCLAIRADCNRWHTEKSNTNAVILTDMAKDMKELKEMVQKIRDDFYKPTAPTPR